MVYPEKELDRGVGGRVYVRFVVGADGRVSNVKVMKGVSPALDAEALRAVRSMPRWIPGRNNGKPVNQWYNLPIRFNPG
jgi:protein TonB